MFSSTSLMSFHNSQTYIGVDRRRLLGAMLFIATTTGASMAAQAETTTATKKSNFNYELGNGECQTSCALKCQSETSNTKNSKQIKEDCLDACVRSGQRYCHQATATKSSPSAEEATASRYVSTTMEPKITASKPIPGLLYDSNRGGAWRD